MTSRAAVAVWTVCVPLWSCAPADARRLVDDDAAPVAAGARTREAFVDAAGFDASTPGASERATVPESASALVAPALAIALEPAPDIPVPPAMPAELEPLEGEPGACRARLARLGVTFRRSGELLGVEDPVVVQPPIAGVRFRWSLEDGPQAPMRMDCRLALALHAMAVALRDTWRITDVVHYGTYSYRCVRGVEPCRMSQHAFGLALDLAAFVDADGQSYWVRRDFVPNGRPSCPARAETEGDQLLKDAACWMVQTRAFGLVLTPNFNAIHENHYHIGVSVRGLGDFAARPHVIDPPWVPRAVEEPSPDDFEHEDGTPLEDEPLDGLEEFAYGPGAGDAVLVDPVTLEPLRASGLQSAVQTGSALLAPRWTPASGASERPVDCTLRTHRTWPARPLFPGRE